MANRIMHKYLSARQSIRYCLIQDVQWQTLFCNDSSVSDLDPDWIRIGIQEGKNDPKIERS